MSPNRIPIPLIAFLAVVVVTSGCSGHIYVQSNADRDALQKTSKAIRTAFASGDIATIMAFHHPEVVKSLNYGNYLIGGDAVRKDIAATLQRFNLE
jgi:hypothetical protein